MRGIPEVVGTHSPDRFRMRAIHSSSRFTPTASSFFSRLEQDYALAYTDDEVAELRSHIRLADRSRFSGLSKHPMQNFLESRHRSSQRRRFDQRSPQSAGAQGDFRGGSRARATLDLLRRDLRTVLEHPVVGYRIMIPASEVSSSTRHSTEWLRSKLTEYEKKRDRMLYLDFLKERHSCAILRIRMSHRRSSENAWPDLANTSKLLTTSLISPSLRTYELPSPRSRHAVSSSAIGQVKESLIIASPRG